MSILARFAQSFSRFLYNLTGADMFRVRRKRMPPWIDQPIQRSRRLIRTNQRTIQELRGLLFLFLAFFVIFILFPYLGGRLFEAQVIPGEVAARLRSANPFYRRFPIWMLYRFEPRILRYAIAPLLATLVIFFSAGKYVQNVYNLRRYSDGLRYVVSSMFALRYPILRIQNGKEDLNPGDTNLLIKVGGPGFVMIEPGNAVLFKKINESSDVPVHTGHFVEPFEQIAQVADLEEQEGYLDNATSTTMDGIRVKLNDIRYRYRIIPPVVDGRPIQRNMQDPYPYSSDAVIALAYGSSMNEDGPDAWSAAVQRFIKSALSEQINKNTVDYLTAPRNGREKPRALLRSVMESDKVKGSLASVGAQLIWIDVGHIDVIDKEVDDTRVDYWSTDMDGEIHKQQAIGEARRLALRELGRAEAQAKMITAIGKALEEMDIAANSKDNLRTLLLVRTSQILDAMRDTPNHSIDNE